LLYRNVEYLPNGTLRAELGPLLPFFGVFFLVQLIAVISRLINRFRKTVGLEKEQFKYLTFGIALMLIFVGIFDIFFILLLKNTSFTTLGVSSFVFLEGAVFYSITRHRLLDIRLVVARTVAYSLLTTALFAFYVFSTLIVTTLFLKTPTRIEQLLLFGVLALMVAYSFQPLRKAFEHFTDRIFYKDRYDSDELLSKLTKIMATTLGLSNLTEKLLIKLVPEMKISKAAFVLMNKGKVTHIENAGFDKNVKFISTDILSLVEKGKLIFIEEARDKHIKKIMYNLGITVSVPLLVGKKELGVLLLGHKLSGEVYTDQDIKFLEILAPETSVAIENAKAYEEIRKFSITLQKEVEKATSDLRHANERLKELDKLKDEFMSIASHVDCFSRAPHADDSYKKLRLASAK
jgi:K+-sensing histidine kinase KdpD